MSFVKISLSAVALCAVVLSSAATHAAQFYASFRDDETIGSTGYLEEDIVLIDNQTGAISLYDNGADYFSTSGEDIDALYVDALGGVYFSTTAGATVVGGAGGIQSGDIVRYDPVTMLSAVYLADVGPDVDAFWIEAGVPYLSLSVDEDDLGFNDIDVEDDMVFTVTGAPDLTTGIVTVVFDSNDYLLDAGVAPNGNTDIDAFAITSDGKYIFSTSSDNDFLPAGGMAGDEINRDGGVVYIFDPASPGSFDPTLASTIYFDASAEFGTSVNIDGLHALPIPEPGSAMLITLAVGALLAGRRRAFRTKA